MDFIAHSAPVYICCKKKPDFLGSSRPLLELLLPDIAFTRYLLSIVITASFRKLKVKRSKQFLLQIILYSCPGFLSSQENWHWFFLFYQSRQISDPPPIQSSHNFLLSVIWSHLELGTGLKFSVLRPYKPGQMFSNDVGLNNAGGCCWAENGAFNIFGVRRSQTQGVWYWGGLWGVWEGGWVCEADLDHCPGSSPYPHAPLTTWTAIIGVDRVLLKDVTGWGWRWHLWGEMPKGSALVLVKIYLRTSVKDYKGIYFIL